MEYKEVTAVLLALYKKISNMALTSLYSMIFIKFMYSFHSYIYSYLRIIKTLKQ